MGPNDGWGYGGTRPHRWVPFLTSTVCGSTTVGAPFRPRFIPLPSTRPRQASSAPCSWRITIWLDVIMDVITSYILNDINELAIYLTCL